MKNNYFLLLVCLLFINGAYAQKNAPSPEQRAQKHTQALTKALKLTPEQQTKVQEINLETAQSTAKMRAEIKAAGKISEDQRKAYRQQLKANREDHDKKVDALLDADQKTKYKKWREEHHHKATKKHKKKGNHHHEPGLDDEDGLDD